MEIEDAYMCFIISFIVSCIFLWASVCFVFTDNKQNASIIDAVVMGGEGKKQIQVQRISQGSHYVQVLVEGVNLDLSSVQDLHINGNHQNATGRTVDFGVLIVFGWMAAIDFMACMSTGAWLHIYARFNKLAPCRVDIATNLSKGVGFPLPVS